MLHRPTDVPVIVIRKDGTVRHYGHDPIAYRRRKPKRKATT